MKQKIRPSDVSFVQQNEGVETLSFNCDNDIINRWFSNDSQREHENFNCRVTHAYVVNDRELAGFYSLTVKLEPQLLWAGHSFIMDTIFEADLITTIHLKWIAVRGGLERRELGTIMMGQIIEDAYAVIMKAGAQALTLQYIGAASERLYKKFRFLPYGDTGKKGLFLSARAIRELVETNGI